MVLAWVLLSLFPDGSGLNSPLEGSEESLVMLIALLVQHFCKGPEWRAGGSQ